MNHLEDPRNDKASAAERPDVVAARERHLLTIDRLTDALFIEYGTDHDPASRLRLNNLAFDMHGIVHGHPGNTPEELLAMLKETGGYQKTSSLMGISDDLLLGCLGNLKRQIN